MIRNANVGSRIAFFLYALATLLVLAIFVYVHCYRRGVGLNFVDDWETSESATQGDIMLDEAAASGALAPHGVPTAPVTMNMAGGVGGGSELDQWGTDPNQQQQQQYDANWTDPNTAWS